MWPDRVMGVWPTEGFTPALGASREHRPESPRDACPSNSHQQSTSWRLLEAARGAPAPPGRKVGSRCVKVSAGESGGKTGRGSGLYLVSETTSLGRTWTKMEEPANTGESWVVREDPPGAQGGHSVPSKLASAHLRTSLEAEHRSGENPYSGRNMDPMATLILESRCKAAGSQKVPVLRRPGQHRTEPPGSPLEQ